MHLQPFRRFLNMFYTIEITLSYKTNDSDIKLHRHCLLLKVHLNISAVPTVTQLRHVCLSNLLQPCLREWKPCAHIKTVLCDHGLMSLCPLFCVIVLLQLTLYNASSYFKHWLHLKIPFSPCTPPFITDEWMNWTYGDMCVFVPWGRNIHFNLVVFCLYLNLSILPLHCVRLIM